MVRDSAWVKDRWREPPERRHRWFLWLLVVLAAVVVADQLGIIGRQSTGGRTRVLSEVVTTSTAPPVTTPVLAPAPTAPAPTTRATSATTAPRPTTTAPRVTATTRSRPAHTTATTTTTEPDTVKPYDWNTPPNP